MKAKIIIAAQDKVIAQKSIFDFSKITVPAMIAGYKTFATSSLAECQRLAMGKTSKAIAARAFLAVIAHGFYNGARLPDSMKGESYKARLYNHISAGITIPAQEKDEAGVPVKMTGAQMRAIVAQIESMQHDFIVAEQAAVAAADAAAADAAAADAADAAADAAAAAADAAAADAAAEVDLIFSSEYEGDFTSDCIAFLKAQGYSVSRRVSTKPAKQAKVK